MRRLCRVNYLFLRRVRLAHNYIVAYGTFLQPRFLQYHAVVAPQAVPRNVAYIRPVNAYAARVHVIEAHKQIYERCFAAARGPHYRHALAALHVQIKTLYKRPVRNV